MSLCTLAGHGSSARLQRAIEPLAAHVTAPAASLARYFSFVHRTGPVVATPPARETAARRAVTPQHEAVPGVDSGASLDSSFSSGVASSTAAVAGESSAPWSSPLSQPASGLHRLQNHLDFMHSPTKTCLLLWGSNDLQQNVSYRFAWRQCHFCRTDANGMSCSQIGGLHQYATPAGGRLDIY